MMTATVMNLQAANVYFKVTSTTSWWANDGAKIGALFKVGTDPLDEGAYAQFFTLVPGTTDTYVGTVPVPEGEDPFVAVQFLRYNSAATNPEDMNYWNATVLMTWDGVNDMFTATAFGDTWDSTTGTWSKYAPAGPDMHDFLYFVGLNGNDTVRLNKYATKDLDKLTATFEYSKDRINWNDYSWTTSASPANTYQGDPIALNQGDTVFFRAKGVDGKNATMSSFSTTYFLFAFGENDSIAAGGNVMSLYDATCEQDTMTSHGLRNLFYKAKQLVSAPKLPATQLAQCCYIKMFVSNSSLTTAPELPATTLANSCYQDMFYGCTALTQAPELKATTLAWRCCVTMFSGCTALQVDTCTGSCDGAELVVPSTGAGEWNKDMFKNCKGDAKYTAQYGIQLGGHYCIHEHKKYTITTSVNKSSRGYTTGDTTAFYGDTVTIRAEAYYGYHFTRWNDYYEDNPRKVVVTKDINYQAVFSVNNYQLTVSASGPGSVTGSGKFKYLTKDTITATPEPGCQFIQWNDGNKDNPRVITLTQDTAFVASFSAPAAYGRKVTNGNFGTICLTKKFTSMEGVEGLYVPYEKTATTLYCEEVELTDVVAGGAYIFKANADSVTFALEGEAVSAPVNNDHMMGWLADDFVLTGETDSYMLYNNQIIKPEVGSTILKNRAFIDLENVPAKAAAPARGRMIAFGINGTTGLVELNDNANLNANRKVIINGQLIIIRDGKMYNAQGAQL